MPPVKRGIACNALGRSRGGFSTKLHAVVDTKARPIFVTLTPGQRHEMVAAKDLLAHAHGKALIGDTGYDSNDFLLAVRNRGMKPVIHSKPERKKRPRLDRRLYRQRYLVEVFFPRLKRFRAVATRYENGTQLSRAGAARVFVALAELKSSSARGRAGATRRDVGRRSVRPRTDASPTTRSSWTRAARPLSSVPDEALPTQARKGAAFPHGDFSASTSRVSP